MQIITDVSAEAHAETLVPWERVRSVLYVGARNGAFKFKPALRRHNLLARIDFLEAHGPHVELLDALFRCARVHRGSVVDFEFDCEYDLVVWWHGPEHVTLEEFPRAVKNLIIASKVRLLVACPWGKREQGEKDGNPHERHRWSVYPGDLAVEGFEVFAFGKRDGGGHLVGVL